MLRSTLPPNASSVLRTTASETWSPRMARTWSTSASASPGCHWYGAAPAPSSCCCCCAFFFFFFFFFSCTSSVTAGAASAGRAASHCGGGSSRVPPYTSMNESSVYSQPSDPSTRLSAAILATDRVEPDRYWAARAGKKKRNRARGQRHDRGGGGGGET